MSIVAVYSLVMFVKSRLVRGVAQLCPQCATLSASTGSTLSNLREYVQSKQQQQPTRKRSVGRCTRCGSAVEEQRNNNNNDFGKRLDNSVQHQAGAVVAASQQATTDSSSTCASGTGTAFDPRAEIVAVSIDGAMQQDDDDADSFQTVLDVGSEGAAEMPKEEPPPPQQQQPEIIEHRATSRWLRATRDALRTRKVLDVLRSVASTQKRRLRRLRRPSQQSSEHTTRDDADYNDDDDLDADEDGYIYDDDDLYIREANARARQGPREHEMLCSRRLRSADIRM